MEEPDLTPFQTKTEHRFKALLDQCGISWEGVKREVYEGVIPFYSDDVQVCLRFFTAAFDIWVYDCEASYAFTGGGKAMLERDDFKTEEELIDGSIDQLSCEIEGSMGA